MFDLSAKYLITLVDLSFNGLPLNPPLPIEFILSSVIVRLSLLVVVFVATTPDNDVELTSLIIPSNCLSFKSGDILSNIGFTFVCFLL